MKKVNFCNEFEVSQICLGAMDFGTKVDEKTSFDILDTFVENGGNFIDTSNNYAWWAGTGDESETLLGKWMTERKNRDDLIIATKVGFDRHGKGQGLKKEQIEYWIDESLRKLNTDHVDVYYAHTDDANTPIEETMTAFDSLVKKGKVRVLGASNYDVWRFQDANYFAKQNGMAQFKVMQQRFSYYQTRGDIAPKYIFNEYTSRERLRFLEHYDIPLVPFASLARGGYLFEENLPEDYITGNRKVVLNKVAGELGLNPIHLVIAWLLHASKYAGYPDIIPLFSATTPEIIKSNIDACDIVLSDEIMQELNKA